MKRTKEWWTRLTKEERDELILLGKAAKRTLSTSAFLPDTSGKCFYCFRYARYGELCITCFGRILYLNWKSGLRSKK